MLRRQVDGFVIIPAAGGVSRIAGSEFSRTPVVTLDRPIENSSFDSVVVENRSGSQLGVNHLIQHGHRRIAFFGLSRNLYTIRARFEGYRDALKKASMKPEFYFGNGTQTEMITTIRSVLDSKNPPTAFYCSNNLITRNAIHALAHLKVRMPETVALVGFDDFETANILNPPLTVVRQPITDLARMGANILSRVCSTMTAPNAENTLCFRWSWFSATPAERIKNLQLRESGISLKHWLT